MILRVQRASWVIGVYHRHEYCRRSEPRRLKIKGKDATPVLPRKGSINDFAGMMPQVSAHDLEERLKRFKTQTGHTIVVLTVQTIEDDDMESFGRKAFQGLALSELAGA